ncbi:hypothetical protein [Aeromonas dhakensis]|uniref:hypothetical protein n=1 Tax=Aeromonas dhakensis TaxID=196024 RepID=UPI001115CA4C|nr:hypothetical protein [Aeromonas dhakensis]
MANLKDFEDLISKIANKEIKDYMKESMTCYYAGAYRGSIILSYISLFDDLLLKLDAVSDVNKKAKTLLTEVNKRKQSQDVYENYLLEQLASIGLISGLDKDTVDLIKDRRNKSAHPSGHTPSAEEARYIFSEVVEKFLSKPVLSTNSLVDRILSRLGNANFFTSTFITDTRNVTEHEIKNIHTISYPYMLSKLLLEFKESEGERKKNASFLLDGMAALDWDDLNKELVDRVISKVMDDQNYNEKSLSMLSANIKLRHLLCAVDKGRFKSLLLSKIKAMKFNEVSTSLSHPVVVMRKLSEDNAVGEFSEVFIEFIKKVPYRNGTIKIVASNKDILLQPYLEEINSDAGSNQFDTARMFIERFGDIEEEFTKLAEDKEAFTLLCNIIFAARNGTWAAEAVTDKKFERFPNLKTKALQFIESEREQADIIVKATVSQLITIDELCERYL